MKPNKATHETYIVRTSYAYSISLDESIICDYPSWMPKINKLCTKLKTLNGICLSSNSNPRTHLMRQFSPESCTPQARHIR
jgi:hypothetical protein